MKVRSRSSNKQESQSFLENFQHGNMSPEPMLKRMGVSALERKLAVSTKFESTYSQSGNLLTITTRGPAFSRTEAVPPIKTNIGENASLGNRLQRPHS